MRKNDAGGYRSAARTARRGHREASVPTSPSLILGQEETSSEVSEVQRSGSCWSGASSISGRLHWGGRG